MPLHGQDFSGSLSPVAIFGPGLIGGSIGKALRRLPGQVDLRFFARSPAKVSSVFPDAFCSSDAGEVARGAALVVFCTPVEHMPGLAKEIAGSLDSAGIVTDAGSVKAPVVSALEPIFGPRFVGAHPMAGSERAGIEASSADLFDGARCAITPTPASDPSAVNAVETFWQSLGCRTSRISPGEHDRLVAHSSHLPHAVAAALISTVADSCPKALHLAGGGLRDSTRIASGPAIMWAGIFSENRAFALEALDAFLANASRLRDLVGSGDLPALEAFLERSAAARENLE